VLTVITSAADGSPSGGDGPSQQAISAALGIDRATVVSLVDELERRGLVRRTPNSRDRRAHALRATPGGQRLAAEAHVLMDACEDAFTGVLTTAERKQLTTLLDRLFTASSRAAKSVA
jgi:DNA-binding MarR family transcriptional regulator